MYAYSFLLALTFLNVLVWSALIKGESFSVTFFDIGQGDSIFIQTPNGHQILIDGGPGITVIEKLGRSMPFWDRRLDLIILTHPEQDHISGLIEVLRRYEVDMVLWTGVVRDTSEWQAWITALPLVDRVVIANAPQRIDWTGKGYMDVLSPVENLNGIKLKDSNPTSVVTRLVIGKDSILLTGDIPKKTELELMRRGESLQSTVLKIAHHGSSTSSSSLFVHAVAPLIAVIQAGRENRYGHPHKDTLATLEKYGIKVLRTDIKGDITLRF